MRKFLMFAISVLFVAFPLSCLAADTGDFAVNQALALYSLTEDGNSITVSEDGITVNGREITVAFSSDELISNLSEISLIAYKPQGNDATPSKDNIYYLDQLVYSSGSVSFEISPDAPEGTYVLLMGGSDLSAVARVTFGIGVDPDIVLGDVNNDSVFNTLDVIKLKRYIANVESVVDLWTDRNTYAADLNSDGYVNTLDVALMKEALANRIVE